MTIPHIIWFPRSGVSSISILPPNGIQPQPSSTRLSRTLNTGYIDLFLIHGPLMGPEKRLATWKNLNDFVREDEEELGRGKGRVRSVGVSNL